MNITKMAAAIAVGASMILASSCANKQEKEMGPEETVLAFIEALTQGNSTQIGTLCDTLSMKEYLNAFSNELEKLQKDNSTVAAIALKLVSESDISVEVVIKDGDRRKVIYTISSPEGGCKKKIAVVKKEEGAWKVEKITDSL